MADLPIRSFSSMLLSSWPEKEFIFVDSACEKMISMYYQGSRVVPMWIKRYVFVRDAAFTYYLNDRESVNMELLHQLGEEFDKFYYYTMEFYNKFLMN